MAASYARAALKADESVVVVSTFDGSDYCSGFVVASKGRCTYVLTQSVFVKDRDNNLKVRYFDGVTLRAKVSYVWSTFSMIRTELHINCTPIEWIEGDVTVSSAFALVPSSAMSQYHIPCYVILETLDSYNFDGSMRLEGSEKHFLVACQYGAKCEDGYSRHIAAPVFYINDKDPRAAKALGLLCNEFRLDPESMQDEAIKIGFSARYIKDFLDNMVAQQSSTNKIPTTKKSSDNIKTTADKRKRDEKSSGAVKKTKMAQKPMPPYKITENVYIRSNKKGIQVADPCKSKQIRKACARSNPKEKGRKTRACIKPKEKAAKSHAGSKPKVQGPKTSAYSKPKEKASKGHADSKLKNTKTVADRQPLLNTASQRRSPRNMGAISASHTASLSTMQEHQSPIKRRRSLKPRKRS